MLQARTLAEGGVIEGGSGNDVMSVLRQQTLPTSLVLDNREEVLRVDGAEQLRWHSFEGFNGFEAVDATFLGTDRAEYWSAVRGDLHARLSGGDDTVNEFMAFGTPGSDIAGGRGRDLLSLFNGSSEHPVVDLAKGRAVDGVTTTSFSSIETYVVNGESDDARVTVKDTSGPDDVSVSACRSSVRGYDGDDRLRLTYDPNALGCQSDARQEARGGPGDDRLVGSRWSDVLLGGTGRDSADGGDSTDHCVAESERSCES